MEYEGHNFLLIMPISEEAVERLVKIDEKLLVRLLANTGKTLLKHKDKRQTEEIFFTNYRLLLLAHHKLVCNGVSNNLALHFALLTSHCMIQKNRIDYALRLLKQTYSFDKATDVDQLLLTISFNNLATLYFYRGKYRKSLTLSLKEIVIMRVRFYMLKRYHNQKQLIYDAIVLVSGLNRAIKCCEVMAEEDEGRDKVYRRVSNSFRCYGQHIAGKYLQKGCKLAQKWFGNYQPVKAIKLPVIKPMPGYPFVTTVLGYLRNIEQMIKNNDFGRDQHRQTLLLHYEHIFDLDNRRVTAKIYHEDGMINTQDKYDNVKRNIPEYCGQLQIIVDKGKETMTQTIDRRKMLTILSLLNVYDVLGREMQMYKLSCRYFIKLLFRFVTIDTKGIVQIRPRAITIIQPFIIKFCGQDVIVMVNHIRYGYFRIAICPIDSSKTLYLDVYLINQYWCVGCAHGNTNKTYIKHPSPTKPNIGQQPPNIRQHIMTKIQYILTHFERTLGEYMYIDNNYLGHIVFSIAGCSYYKYKELMEKEGRIVICRYLANIRSVELYMQNCFYTCSIEGKVYAKGRIAYPLSTFIKEFGPSCASVYEIFRAYCHVVESLYSLKVFIEPIGTYLYDFYVQNAIVKNMLSRKPFCIKFVALDNYLCIVTVEILVINNYVPIGVSITAYECSYCLEIKYFLFIVAEHWLREGSKESNQQGKQYVNNEGNQKVQEHYFHRQYILAYWLYQEGFKRLFDKIRVTEGKLHIIGLTNNITLYSIL